jgi:hypothetical protein
MKPRTLRLIGMLETYSSDYLQKLFASRMACGESFRHVCDSMLIPYNMTAEVIGWDRISKTFGEPYRPQAPTMPTKCVKPHVSLPPPNDGDDYGVI